MHHFEAKVVENAAKTSIKLSIAGGPSKSITDLEIEVEILIFMFISSTHHPMYSRQVKICLLHSLGPREQFDIKKVVFITVLKI